MVPKTAKIAAEIPFTRKRLLHEQTTVLLAVFEQKTHPSREDRVILAAELGMQLKTVSAWFQNRRRNAKKKSLAWSRRSIQENRRVRYTSGPRTPPAISLDCIASARERPTHTSPRTCITRFPLASHRLNAARISPFPSKSAIALWEHIPSSPPAPPSSPMAESARMSVLGTHSKVARSLEWACAKARAGRKASAEHDLDVPALDLDDMGDTVASAMDDDSDTEMEDFEVITPDSSATELLPSLIPSEGSAKKMEANPPAEEMEAAMALLGFMGNSA